MGFSDALGQTNSSLIRRTCTANGTLLPPAKPLTSIDKLLLAPDGEAPSIFGSYDGSVPRGVFAATAQSGSVGAAVAGAVVVHCWYLVSFGSWGDDGVAPFPVASTDLWPSVVGAVDSTHHTGRAALWQCVCLFCADVVFSDASAKPQLTVVVSWCRW